MKQFTTKTRLARAAMTLLAALLTTATAWAQETITVYDGTDTKNCVPFYSTFADYGTRCQFIIPADEISEMAGGSISALTFYSSSSSVSYDEGFTVYLKEVEYTTFATAALEDWDSMDDVYTGTLTISENQLVIEFGSSYTYQGGNLMIGFQITTWGSSCPNNIYWYGKNQESVTALYNNANSSHVWSSTYSEVNFIPKTTFTYTPGSGVVYQKPANLTVSDLTSDGATISWTAPESGSPTGYAYQYKKAADEEWSALATTTETSVSISGLATATAYNFRVKAVYGTDGESGFVSKNFTTFCAAYDIPYTYGFEEAAPFDCWTVISGNVSRQSGTTNSDSYRLDFRGTTSNMIALPQLTENTNTLRVEFYTRPESTGGNSGKFAIGYMTDITDASTFVAVATYNSTEMTTNYVKKTVDFASAPADAIIAMRQFDCQTNYYWYVDDVTVKAIPSCLAPTALGADNIITTSAELQWTANGSETAWTVYYKKVSAETYTEVTNVTENHYTLNGLDAASSYQFYVVANCSASDSSEPSEVFTFITECDVINALGYSENFDSYTGTSSGSTNNLPNCWNHINTCSYSYNSGYPIVYTYSAFSSPNCLKLYSSYSSYSDNDPQPQYAILPPMENLAGKQVRLMARGYNTSSTFKIGTMSNPTDASTFTQIAAEQTLTTSYSEDPFEYIIPATCTDSYLAIMIDAATSSRTTNSVLIDDIEIREAPICIKPSGLEVTASSITANGATITWSAGGSETSWQIEYATDADFTSSSFETVEGEPTYTFHGLDESTTYYVHVQAVCGGSDGASEYSKAVSFTTIQAPVNLPYSNDFESTNDWLFVNGDLTNTWAWGEATNNGGTHAIYVSNDGGYTNAYDNSNTMVYVTKTFNFEAGSYVFSYDWKAFGESTYDYLRVALVPSSVTLTAGTNTPSGFSNSNLPTGWIALDGGTKLNLQTAWQSNVSNEINIATAGTYMMVFAWRNDGSTNNNPPAAIDNVSIEAVTCPAPTGLAIADNSVTAHGATITWDEEEGATFQWKIATEDEWTDTQDNSVELSGLTPDETYTFSLRRKCSNTDFSQEVTVNFTTTIACPAPGDLTVSNLTATSATLTWTELGEGISWFICLDGDEKKLIEVNETTYTFATIQTETVHTVKVKSDCSAAWSSVVEFEPTAKTVIGSGTKTSNHLPTYTLYYQAFNQQIYTAQELGEAGLIESVDFYCTSAPSNSTRAIDIYMVSTDKDGFESTSDWITVTANDLVYSGSRLFTTGWNSFVFDNPFIYDGTHNVALIIDDNTGGYNGTNYFRAFDATAQALRVYSDNTNYDPTAPSSYNGTVMDVKNQIRILKSKMGGCMKPTGLAVNYTGGTEATISWTSDASAWNMRVNGVEVNGVITNPYTLTGLELATNYEVEVQTVCGDDDTSDWSHTVSFTTDPCLPEDMCEINYSFTDQYNDSWNGAYMNIVDAATGIVLYELTMPKVDGPYEGSFNVCDGREIQFVWVSGSYPNECGYTFYDLNDEIILGKAKNSTAPSAGVVLTYAVDCTETPWRRPTDLTASNISLNSVELSWTENSTTPATAWVVAYKTGEGAFVETNADSNPFTLTGLTSATEYTVKVRPATDEVEKWSNEITFTTSNQFFLADNSEVNGEIISANGGHELDVVLQSRTLYKDGDWNTLYVPFSLSAEQIAASQLAGADIRAFSSAGFNEENGTLTLNFTPAASEGTVNEVAPVTSIEAGTPYLIRWPLPTPDLTINNSTDWDNFATAVNGGNTYAGQLVKLGADISISTMVGTWDGTIADHVFSGTFDGDGHTLTVNIDESSTMLAAPFMAIGGATIKNLKVEGTVNGGIHCAGLVGIAENSTTNSITNCEVAVNVTTTGSHCGGVLGHGRTSTTTISNCLFSGSISGATTATGIFYGWGDNGTHTIENCLFTGSATGDSNVSIDLLKMNGNQGTVNDCYKTVDVGTQGTLTTATGSDLAQQLGDGWEVSGTDVVPKKLVAANIVNPVFTDVTISDAEHPATIDVSGTQSVVFKGTYDKVTFTSDNRHILLLGENNTLYWPENGASVGACRAYFELNGISAGDIITARLFFGDEEGEAQGIRDNKRETINNKHDADGWYSLSGVKVDGVGAGPVPARLRKGLYIVNGRKVVVH